ncbi:MAG: exodeoxyribonuclease I [Burkholderiales bacterium]|nr:exodeoxyribonuclease I [Burkholderiales bacterium]
MSDFSFFWHDYETFGSTPRRHPPAQFAGVRTDAALNELEPPVACYCRPSPDFLPEPEACLLTGITPQDCLQRGLAEHAFADAIEQQLARPATVGVGYNSIRFDDEVTRFLFWRNLLDPYAREWRDGCGRWDLLDVLRCAYALRPGGLQWPVRDDGTPSFRLEDFTRANGLAHEGAHDALADVRATLALARRLKAAQPKLWDFCLKLRRKDAVLEEIAGAQRQGRPFLHVSGRYAAQRGCLALVWPLAPHPTNRNELIVWDLAEDPAELERLRAAEIRARLFVPADGLPEGVRRLPIKTIHLNRAPIVIANLKTLAPPMAARWGLDVDAGLRHADKAARLAPKLAGLWPEVFERPAADAVPDVDENLYGGFVGDADRRLLQRLRALPPERLATRRPDFADPRLTELLFRYRARNFPETLSAAEQEQWRQHRAARLLEGVGDRCTVPAYLDRLEALAAAADARGRGILQGLAAYAGSIAPAPG